MFFREIAKDVDVILRTTNNYAIAFEIPENRGDVCPYARADIRFEGRTSFFG